MIPRVRPGNRSTASLVALLGAAVAAAVLAPVPLSPARPTGLTPADGTCADCHERAAFGVAATVARVNGIDPEWGVNRGGTVAVSPGGTMDVEWRVTGLGYDYREVAGFVFVPDTAAWKVGAMAGEGNGRGRAGA